MLCLLLVKEISFLIYVVLSYVNLVFVEKVNMMYAMESHLSRFNNVVLVFVAIILICSLILVL